MVRCPDWIVKRFEKTRKKRILVVDDDQELRAVIQAFFEKKGHKVIHACDGEEALQKVKSTRPDIIILDVMMPKKSGLEVASEIKDNPDYDSIPIIILTVISQISGKGPECRRAKSSADLFISKPFDYIEFVCIVEKMLEEHEQKPAKKREGG